jgi:hypothetical protein
MNFYQKQLKKNKDLFLATKQIDRIMSLFENNYIVDEIVSFTEHKYKSKINEKCEYCNNKPTKIWKYKKNNKIKVCKKCCKKNRDTFYFDL